MSADADDTVAPEAFMRRAIALARRGMRAGDGGPFGALVVRGGAVVGEGWNRVLASNDPTAHAEIEAIRGASRALGSYSLAGCDLYTTGEPCPMCLGAIYWARIRRIYFGFDVEVAAAIDFDDRRIYAELARAPAQRSIASVRVLAGEAEALAREYAGMPGRVHY